MVLTESSTTAHLYLAVAAIVLLSLFIVFIYLVKKRGSVDSYDASGTWMKTFNEAGISASDVALITHDDNVWYYDGHSTCIGYGDASEECPRYECWCAGDRGDGGRCTYGTIKQQAAALRKAIANGGQHSECPLIYNDDVT